ncbi:MAG: hypothetical protein F4Z96_03100 [Chloroflexi bacterium]|nr:hypothetical protein [Chloroflexota bacterium]
MCLVAGKITITVEIEGNVASFERRIPELDEPGSVRWERVGSEVRITFLRANAVTEYLKRLLDLVERSGVELLRLDTGTHEVEEAFLRRLEEDRSRGVLRAPDWAAQEGALEPGAEEADRGGGSRSGAA